jgi:outer membrane receptor protein involved in Fe transport
MRFAHLLASTALVAAAVPAFAQSSTAVAATESEDTIVVTGSRIPRPQYEGTIPGVQIEAKDIESRGFTSVLEALNDQPLAGPGASPIGNAGGQPASLGAAFVDLLDLGTARTLTLVNGRRFISGNAGSLFVAANATGGQVDLNVIPTALTERIDTLTVGGAVAYGSDAIAGVVNVILKDNFEGFRAAARTGVTSKNDAFNYEISSVYGRNFADDRGNIAGSFQYNHDDGLQGNERPDYAASYIAPTFFGNGAVRNTRFAPSATINVTTTNNGAFLRAADDGQPGNTILPLVTGGSVLLSPGGNVFQFLGALPTGVTGANFNGGVAGNQVGALQSLAGNTQLIPGVPVVSATANGLNGNVPSVGGAGLAPNTFTRFAPSALPAGATAAQVVTALAPTFNQAGVAAAALNTLAINLLQANRPTPREFFTQNPNTPLNAFLGSFIPAYLDVPNTNAASAAFLPRTAVPLQFDNSGNLVPYTVATLSPTTPGTVGGAPGGAFYNPTEFVVLRTKQDRYIGNVFGHFDVTPNVRFYTENLFARVENTAEKNAASQNTLGSGGTENATVVASINNPFLSASSRATLTAAGVPVNGLFALSRTNQDIMGDQPAFVNTTTLRTVNGFKGDFGLAGRDFTYDASFTYGKSKATIRNSNIRDVEYALALDAVTNAAGQIVCRVQLPGASTALPLGVVNSTLRRVAGADGVLVEQLVPRTVTAAQIAGCQPLNPFGFNQMSEASKRYVRFDAVAKNEGEQMFGQATLATASLFDLPGGGLGFAASAEWRRETIDYTPSEEAQLGVARTAALAATAGSIRSVEGSLEARIPIFGEDFSIPLFESLEFTPGVRFVKQSGDAPDVRRLNGALETNEASGDTETLYSLAGTWRPIRDIQFRANRTRSIRQPSIVELFLGNQPAFNTPTDPCSNNQINAGLVPATRRANCAAEVVRLGIAPNTTAAQTFLNSFVSAGQALQGGFAGSPALAPEKGKSWTVGAVVTPRWVPGLTFSADYLEVKVEDQIIPTTLSTAAQQCFDSPTFGDTTGTIGVNACNFFDREPTVTVGGAPQFNIRNGFASGFINLGAIRVKAVNGAANYKFEIADLVGGTDKGNFELKANVYRLISYVDSPAGDFTDNQESAGGFFRPKWETQLRGRYEKDGFAAQWTWNWQSKTRLFSAANGTFATIELQNVIDFPAFSVHDATLQYEINDNIELQFVTRNIFDKRYAGANGFANGISAAVGTTSGQVDFLGRRFQLTARVKF